MDHGHIDTVYFWSSVLIAVLPVTVFVVIAFKVTRAYFTRREADGGGDPPGEGRDRRDRVEVVHAHAAPAVHDPDDGIDETVEAGERRGGPDAAAGAGRLQRLDLGRRRLVEAAR